MSSGNKKRKTSAPAEPAGMSDEGDLLSQGEGLLQAGAVLARTAVARGQSLVRLLVAQIRDEARDDPAEELFHAPIQLFRLALKLDPDQAAAKLEIENLRNVFGPGDPEPRPPPNHPHPFDVIIVGAGASGIGIALMLTRTFDLDPARVLLLERGEAVGESFRRWPEEMRFISPSFNNQGWTNSFDLNSVAFGTSPAYTLGAEHPSGEEYAYYLQCVAKAGELRIQTGTEVTDVKKRRRGGFEVDVVPAAKVGSGMAKTTLRSRFVVWAAGEFQYPSETNKTSVLFPGSELCRHNSSVQSYLCGPGGI